MNDYTVMLDFRYARGKFLGLKNDPHTAGVIAQTGEYSRSEVEVFERFIRFHDYVLDAGALFGAHTIPLAQMASEGCVFSFEPQRIPFQILCANIQLNQLPNVWAYQMALGDKEARAATPTLSVHTTTPVYWGMQQTSATSCSEFTNFSVPQCTVDSLRLGGLDFMKLDVEGKEAAILRGAERTILACSPVIYAECHTNQAEIISLLRRMGYGQLYIHDLIAQPGTPMLLAIPEERQAHHSWLADMGFAAA